MGPHYKWVLNNAEKFMKNALFENAIRVSNKTIFHTTSRTSQGNICVYIEQFQNNLTVKNSIYQLIISTAIFVYGNKKNKWEWKRGNWLTRISYWLLNRKEGEMVKSNNRINKWGGIYIQFLYVNSTSFVKGSLSLY